MIAGTQFASHVGTGREEFRFHRMISWPTRIEVLQGLKPSFNVQVTAQLKLPVYAAPVTPMFSNMYP